MNEELKQILEKVRALYFRYGIKSVTMDDIARELGISKKTLYQYVADKNELVSKVVELEIEERACVFEKLNCEGFNAIEEIFEVHKVVNKMLKEFNPATLYDLKKYYPDLHQQIIKTRRSRIHQITIENLRKGKAEGIYRTDLNDELIAKMQLSRIEAAFDTEIFTSEELLSSQLFMELFVYHIRGISNEKGNQVLEHVIAKYNQ